MPPTNDPSLQPTSPFSGRLAPLSEDPAPLFVYGSLLFPEVLHILIGRDPEREPVTVPGWRVIAFPGQVYPTLIAQDGATATGHLLLDLTDEDWMILDAFENPNYRLANVKCQAGQFAYTYAAREPFPDLREAWTPSHFCTFHLNDYLERVLSWQQRRREDANLHQVIVSGKRSRKNQGDG